MKSPTLGRICTNLNENVYNHDILYMWLRHSTLFFPMYFSLKFVFLFSFYFKQNSPK